MQFDCRYFTEMNISIYYLLEMHSRIKFKTELYSCAIWLWRGAYSFYSTSTKSYRCSQKWTYQIYHLLQMHMRTKFITEQYSNIIIIVQFYCWGGVYTVRQGVKGRWGVMGHLQNDSYQAMYMHHDNVVDYLEKYDIYDCLSNFCLTKIYLFFEIWVK